MQKVVLTLCLIVGSCVAAFAQSEVLCNDGVDNDGDGLVDCNDGNCQFAANIEKGCRCYDNIDNDGDGKIDKADGDCASYFGLTFVGQGSNCSITPPGSATPFTGVGNPIVSGQNTSDTQSKVAVGDIDGDGYPDAVITSKWNSQVRVVSTGNFSGFASGDIKADFKTTGQGAAIFPSGSGKSDPCDPKNLLFEHEVLIADIDHIKAADGKYKGEIFAIVSNRKGNPESPPTCYFLIGFTYPVGGGTLQVLPGYPVNVGTDRPGIPGIADFDGDGKAEVYLKNKIYAAENGKLLADGGGNWDSEINSGPAAANITGDNKLELICGNLIYTVPSLASRSLQSMTLFADMNSSSATKYYPRVYDDVVEYGLDNHSSTSVADIDEDGSIDVLITGSTIKYPAAQNTAIFYWNVKKNIVSTYLPPDPVFASGWPWGTGRINIGDSDGDGDTEATFIAGSQIFNLEFDPATTRQTLSAAPKWIRTINDSRSGVLTVTIYDFNNDGNPEMVYRDSQELAVIDGKTGTNKQWSAVCQSHTFTEGPIIADVNGDGGTDICVPCFRNANAFDINAGLQQQALGEVRLFFSSANAWLPTRQVWNQPGYFVVNINDNLTLPFPQLDQNMIFGTAPCPNGLPGPQMPLNIFLNQVPHLSANGCPVYPAPDLTYVGDTPNPTNTDTDGDGTYTPAVVVIPPICGDLGIQVYFNIINNGDLPISDNVPVSFFNGDPTLNPVTATKLFSSTIAINNLQVGQKLVTPTMNFNGPGTTFKLFIVLYNDGTSLPISLTGQSTKECTISNNIYSVDVVPDPFTVTVEKLTDNQKCSAAAADNGSLRAHIFKGGVEVTDYSPFAFQWYTGNGTASPIAGPAGTAYNLLGRSAGDYTVVVTNTQKGCKSQPITGTLTQTVIDPTINITVLSNQTQCSPANGKLQADVVGGNTGYTFDWYDISLVPLGVAGPIANNLIAGNYVVLVSKSGCTKTSAPATVLGPQIPDAQASVLQNVVDCSNPNSGSITADALFNAAVQPAANYTFNWYFFDNPTLTRGSILPPANGTGQTRTGLAIGYYQVEIKENTTQCISQQSPVVHVVSQAVIPDPPVITQLAPQTSCDPTKPNGILTADVFVGGVAQSPNGFTFEWFKGQNTLPANKVATVSDVNGKTVNQVVGGGTPYTVKVTTPFHCIATSDFTIAENIQKPVVTLAQLTPNSICDPLKGSGAYSGSLKATVTFGGSSVTLPDNNYLFTWLDGSNAVIPVADNKNPVLGALKDGNYSITVTRADLFCTSAPDAEPVLKATILPLIKTDSIASTNCVVVYKGSTISNGKVMVKTVDGILPSATANYLYEWLDNSLTAIPGATSDQMSKVQGGSNYTIRITNKTSGCENTHTIPLPDAHVIPVVNLVVVTPNSICDPAIAGTAFNGKIQSNFTTPSGNAVDYQYTWKNVTGNTALGTTPPAQAGLTINQFGGLNGNITYSVVAENTVLGCTSGVSQVFLPNAQILPNIKMDSVASSNCVVIYKGSNISNGSVSIVTVDGINPSATANYTYSWGDAGSPTGVSAQTGSKILNVQGGFSYMVEVTNKLSGCKNTHTTPLPDLSVIPVVSLSVLNNNGICNPALAASTYNGKVQAAFTTNSGNVSDYQYTWRNATDNVALGKTPPAQPTLTVLQFGGLNGNKTYGVVAENTVLGCTSAEAQVFLPNVIQLPLIKTDSIPSTNCTPAKVNGRVTVTSIDGFAPVSTPNYSLFWSDDGATPTSIAGQTVDDIQNLQGGFQYTIAVTNKITGCANTHVIPLPDLKSKPIISLAKIKDNLNCDVGTFGASGEIDATVTDHAVVQNAVIGTLPAHYTITWSTSANGEALTGLAPGSYSATVEDTNLGCVSDPDTQVILNAFNYPAIAIPTPTDQTSCDISTPNGSVQATITGGPAGSTFQFTWHQGVGTTGSSLANAAAQPTGTVTTLPNRSSDDYTLFVRNEMTGCETVKSAFVPDNLTYPVVSLANTQQVTICQPTPDGAAQATLSNLSALPGVSYDLFYVYTFQGGAFPTDPAVIKASADPKNISNGSAMVPPAYANMAPGYLTAVIVDRNTKCESNPSTVQIIDATLQNKIQVNGTTNAAFCGGVGGAIDVTVSGGVAPQTYNWFQGTPANNNINFYNNPPDMTSAVAVAGANGVVNGAAEDLGPPSLPAAGVGAGTYTIVITDAKGCGAYFVKNVPFTNPPTFNVVETDVRKCVAPFDGRIDVNITSGISPAGYTIKIFSGNGPTGALLSSNGPSPSPASNFAATLAKGQYYVEVRDVDPANAPCPLGQSAELEQIVFGPIVATNNILPNTSCDPDNSGSGSVVLNARPDNKQDLILAPVDFQVTNIVSNTPATPGPVGFVPNVDIPDNGTNSAPLPGFGAGPYTITVTDINSGCVTDVIANIPDQPVLPQIFSVSSLDDSYCAPLSNGRVVVTAVGPGTIPDYHYEWYASSDVSNAANLVYEDDGGGATTGELFNGTKVPGWSAGVPAGKGWSFGAVAGAGNGDRTYYVRAKRVTGTTGVGCYTQLEQKVILDAHKTPDIQLTTFANTSCIPAANEGVIRAATDIAADPLDPNVRNTGTYTYTWNPDPAGGTTSPVAGIARAASFDIDQLNENGGAPYTVTSKNSVNGCVVSGTATIPTNKLPISVISFSKLDQLICLADGEARVTEVKIDASASAVPAVYNFTTPAQLQTNFDFEWFSGDADGDNDPSTFNAAAPLQFSPGNDITDVVLTDDGVVTTQPFPTMGAGTYFVIAKRKPGLTPGAGCTTAPTRITIEDKHIDPKITSIEGFANTSCDAAVTEGRIEIKVNTPSGVGAESGSTYSYVWTQANPLGNPLGSGNSNNVANAVATTLFTIPPTYTPPPAIPAAGSALKEDTYTVVVKNDYSGCTTTTQSVITPTRYPLTLISFTSQNQLICAPDGRITVTEVKIDASTSNLGVFNYNTPALLGANFDLSWFQAPAGNPAVFNPATPLKDALLNPIKDVTLSEDPAQTTQPFVAMGEGTYYVIATRKPGMTPGAGCATAPVRVNLIKQVNTPQITSLQAFNNTSCESTVDEGRITLTMNTTSSVPAESGSTYSYQWIQSNVAGNPGGAGTSPTSGSSLTIPPAFPAAGLKDDTYTIIVQNDYSKCTTTQQAVISPAKLPITLISYITEDQLICNPDGKITVTKVSIDATSSGLGVFNYDTPALLAANFDLAWFRALPATPTTFDPLQPLKDATNTVITDHVLTEDAAFTTQPYPTMGAGTYYVTGTRKSGLSPGAGCTTTPVRIDIKDLHTNPEISFASRANSACNPLKANGSVTATAKELDGSIGAYTYAWLFNSAPNPSVTNTITSAVDGTYELTVTNTATGCNFTSDFKLILDQTMSSPNVIDVDTIDPLDCKPSGSAEVTKISLGSNTNSTLFPPNVPPNNTITGAALATFGYEWYQGSFTPTAIIAGQTAPLLSNLSPGTYFVLVQDPSTDCKSGPKEVVIDDDLIVYPVPRILQTAKQISCTVTGTAALVSTGDGQDDTNPNYTFQWFPSLDLSGAQFAATSTISNLSIGDYSVNITNTVTGCSASALYSIPDEAPLFTPEVSVGGYPRMLCIGLDGSVTARVTNLSPAYPFPFSFTADLYNGGSPNLSAPPDFPSMAAIPGFVADYQQTSLSQGTYTVRITDNNTGCIGVAQADVVDDRELPVIVIVQDNPLTNCDPARANGQLSATADGGKVGGYTFAWYGGATIPTPAGSPITDNDKLIAQGAGSYVVRVVNDLTGCQADLSGSVSDATVKPPVPDPKVVFDRTSCITPNGWVNVSVGGVIFNYTFNWYDGAALKGSADFTGVDYQDLDIGPYTVTATDDVTGCVSPPGTINVADKRVTPQFVISSTPSYCADTGKPHGAGSISFDLTTPDVVLDNAQWTDVLTGGTVGGGPAVYDLFPGQYHVLVTTTEGCTNDGEGEVKTEIAPYNGISQNGDGQNDFFIIDCITNFPFNNVKVFNRSGILVYEADGYNNNDVSFKGTGEKGVYLQGIKLPSGTYFYIIDKRDGSKPVAGYLELDQ
jgi:hypothetical protein